MYNEQYSKIYNQQRPYPYPQKPAMRFDSYDRIFAIIALVLGYTMLKVIMNAGANGSGLGAMAWLEFTGITIFNFFYCKRRNMKIAYSGKVLFFVSTVLSLMLIITDNAWVKSIDVCLIIISCLYFCYSSYHSNNRSVLPNLFKAIFLSPFYEYSALFSAIFHKDKNKSKESYKNIKNIFIGLAMSIPVFIVCMALLMSSDSEFGRGIASLIKSAFNNVFSTLITFAFSLPIGMYIFSAVYSRYYKKTNEKYLSKFPKKDTRILPIPTCAALLTPLILLYSAFILTQIRHLIENASYAGTEFDYSAYARKGFFELCVVALINLSVIAVVMFFIKEGKSSVPKAARFFTVTLSFLTLCLIFTALAKMQMYINMYGMTPLRIYTSIFMIYLAVLFVTLIARQFISRIKFTAAAYLLACAVIIVMSVLPIDGFIADYNIKKSLNGEIHSISSVELNKLDMSVIGILHKYIDEPYTLDGETPSSYMYSRCDYSKTDIYNFNLSRFLANKTIEKDIQNK